MKTEMNIQKMTKKMAGAMMALVLLTSAMNAQGFDLMSAKSADKVAKSRLFTVDNSSFINTFEVSAPSVSVARTSDSLFHVEAVSQNVSSSSSQKSAVVNDFSLDQNYPNPFNPSTTIRFNVGKSAKVSVVLYDISGREVNTLVSDSKEAGSYDVQWNGKDSSGSQVSTGTYFYRLISSNDDGSSNVITKKMTLVK